VISPVGGGAFLAGLLCACEGTPLPPEDPRVWFRAAVAGAPGGAFLSVWGDPRSRRAFVVGASSGSIPGACRAARQGASWSTVGPDGSSRAARPTTHSGGWRAWRARPAPSIFGRSAIAAASCGCARTAPSPWQRGSPRPQGSRRTGVSSRSPDDVWIVGGSPRPDGPCGAPTRRRHLVAAGAHPRERRRGEPLQDRRGRERARRRGLRRTGPAARGGRRRVAATPRHAARSASALGRI